MIAMGIGLLAFFGLAALAVDVGHMAFTATEVQAVADAAATAAAQSFRISDGQAVAGQNMVAGNPAPSACPGDSSTCIELGIWDGNLSVFTPNPTSFNAARATVTVSGVPNIVAGIFGQPDSTVTKVAVAAVRPSLPFALGQGAACGFTQPCDSGETLTINLGNLPGHTPDTGWSTFFPDEACDAGPDTCVLNELPTECGGGGQPMPVLQPSETSFTVRQSYLPRATAALANCVNGGTRNTFLVPFFNCQGSSAPTLSAAAVGFETIAISSVTTSDSGDPIMNVQLSCASASTQVALVQ
jgi:hypothetical protein